LKTADTATVEVRPSSCWLWPKRPLVAKRTSRLFDLASESSRDAGSRSRSPFKRKAGV